MAVEHGTGARGLRSICERVLQDVRIDAVRQLGRIAEHGLRGAASLGGVELADVV